MEYSKSMNAVTIVYSIFIGTSWLSVSHVSMFLKYYTFPFFSGIHLAQPLLNFTC